MPQTYVYLLIAAGIFATGFGSGFELERRLKNADIAELKATIASDKERAANAALSDLRATSAAIHEAAVQYGDSSRNLEVKLNAVRKDLKNIPRLPADCIPGADRLLLINRAIQSANGETSSR
jgi:hypothetical protein